MKSTALTLALLASVGVSAQGDIKKELERFQGKWTATSATNEQIPAGFHAALVFAGDTYQGVRNGKTDERGTVKLDPSTKPMSIALIITEGSSAGKTQLGLVEITGDTMTLTLAEPGDTARPSPTSKDSLTLTKMKPLAKDFEGAWEGALDVGGKSLRLIVKLSNGSDGLATGTLTSVDQGSAEAPIVAVVQFGSRLRLIVPAVRGTFDGELKDKQLTGTWAQGRGSLPLVLVRR